ncbi:MAG: MFS transporter [Anaerolineae bacterium]|nr:MFS transporter [Anaerolineae bacterium]
MALISNAQYFSVVFGHFAVDLLNGQIFVILAYLSEPLGLSNAELGIAGTAYMLSASLMQPVFGYLIDRVGPRWILSGGVLWLGVFFSLGLLTPGRQGLGLLVLASVGSGAFHPAGTSQATMMGRNLAAGRDTSATAMFFVFGQAGLFIGPLLAGYLLTYWGITSLLWLTVITIPVAINAMVRLPKKPVETSSSGSGEQKPPVRKTGAWVLAAFVVLAAFQSWTTQNLSAFLPKHLSDLGQDAKTYGVLASMFMGGSAVGNLVGGNLADKFGKRRVAAAGMTLVSIPIYLLSVVTEVSWMYVLIPTAGLLIGTAFSIIVVLAQRLIPSGIALASGLILGFMFSSGALGALLSGYIADAYGFPVVFQLSAALALSAAVLTSTLQKT